VCKIDTLAMKIELKIAENDSMKNEVTTSFSINDTGRYIALGT
jgi:hypothetical protein